MSLTDHLRSPYSPVRKYMNEAFPNTSAFVRKCNPSLKGLDTVMPRGMVDYMLVGTAIDYRLRYYLKDDAPFEDLVAYKGWNVLNSQARWTKGKGERLGRIEGARTRFSESAMEGFFHDLKSLLAKIRPAGRRIPTDRERLLNERCLVLALFERFFRSGVRPESPLFSRNVRKPEDLLNIISPDHVDDMCEVSSASYPELRKRLREKAVLNPKFKGSDDVDGADGDVILNDCLLDFKTTIRPSVSRSMLYQLLGYVLLDYDDSYKFRRAGLFFTRQGRVIEWDVEELLRELPSREFKSLSMERKRFKEMTKKIAPEIRVSLG